MKILAIDIGGTTTRFAAFTEQSFEQLDNVDVFRLATQSETIQSLNQLILLFSEQKPSSFLELDSYDAISFSVPGPVYDHICIPPNIPWVIDISDLRKNQNVFMLNDFSAQAYACILKNINDELALIKAGSNMIGERMGIIGAGTGLGHCTLLKDNTQYQIIPSEAGHATMSFLGKEEKAFEEFVKEKLNIEYCVTDNIINGRGICLLHEFLTKDVLTAQEICADFTNNAKTLALFSRFYARAARNYCLTNCIDDKLIISGGLAAKNPQLISADKFLNEFYNLTNEAYRPMLENISIYLNKKDEIGLYGAAFYAKTQLECH